MRKSRDVRDELNDQVGAEYCGSCDEFGSCDQGPVEQGDAVRDLTITVKKPRELKDPTFVFVKEPGEGDKKLPQQCARILELIKGAGEGGITRLNLLAQMREAITTVQPIERVLAFYQSKLTSNGYVELR